MCRVGDHRDLGALERVGVFVSPFPGAARIRGRYEPEITETVAVLLAFSEDDPASGFHALEHFRQSVEHAADAVQLPGVTAVPVRAALTKVLR